MNSFLFYSVTMAMAMAIIVITWRLFHGVHRSRNRRSGPPPSIPWSLPVLGHLHLMRHPVHQRLAGYAARYGPVLSLRFGSRSTLIVSSAAAAEECLVAKDTTFANRPRLTFAKVFGYDCTAVDSAPYGPHWRSLRRILAHEVLSQARVTSFADVRGDEVKCFLGKLFRDSGRVLAMRVSLSELTFNLVARIVMGKKHDNGSGGEEDKEFRMTVEEAFLLSGKLCMDDFLPWWVARLFGGGLKERIVRLGKDMDQLLQSLVDERRQRRRRKEVEETALIDVLLELQEKDPAFYSDVIIKGILLTLLSGTDPVTATLEWALSLLLNHPEVAKKAKDEIATHVGDERLLTDSDLPKLVYLHNIIKETLRLFPALPVLIPHESSTDCTISGFNVPSGTALLVNAYAIHRDPKLWEDPLKFDPERFEYCSRVGEQGIMKDFKYIPFGSGRRGCPGEGFSIKMMMVTLGSLIQCFEWERINGPSGELVDLDEGEGFAMSKASPLEAICKPRPHMLHLLSQF